MKVLALESLRGEHRPDVGGKAAALGELAALGLPVPRGFVLPADSLTGADVPALRACLEDAVARAGLRGPFAVRSSAAAEDGPTASFAGQFRSELHVTADGLASAVLRCAASADSAQVAFYAGSMRHAAPAPGVSVIVQEQVNASLSGVMFTGDPLTGDRGTYQVELVRGLGDALTSGRLAPLRVQLDGTDLDVVDRPDWADQELERRVLRLSVPLRALGRAVSDHHRRPQDIEFCVTDADEVILVQARPITALPAGERLDFRLDAVAVDAAARERLGGDLLALDKVRLRLFAEDVGLPAGHAWIISAKAAPDGDPLPRTLPAGLLAAHQVSFVLQRPARFNGAVLRRFSARDSRDADLDGLLQVVGRAHEEFTLIATEVRRARLSGLARRIGDQVIVEVGFGAFVPKGVVSTSQYVCALDGEVLAERPVRQDRAFLIEDGETRVVRIGDTPAMTPRQCREVCRAAVTAAERYRHPSLEFGIEEDGTVFLIDFIEEDAGHQAPPSDLRVVSPGATTGRVLRIADDPAESEEALHAHFHDRRQLFDRHALGGDSVVIAADLPYLSLERVIREHDHRRMAFVFRHCSYLSHLSIVLRELRIPAVVAPEAFTWLETGVMAAVETAPRVRVARAGDDW